MKKLVFILLLFTACNTSQQEAKKGYIDYLKTETEDEKNKRMEWWRDAGFGMFIHWGLYAVPAGQYKDDKNHAEWIQETADIPVEEYELYAKQFNPVKYNAHDWVRMAKEAGMKYIVITSKHHDGFCLWDSKVSDYDIADRTPYKKDLLKELAAACEKEGIILCFYHSIMDWHHPFAQGINHPEYNYGTGPNPDFSRYVKDYMYPQLEELLASYGKIGVLWFDGEWISEWTEKQGKSLYNHLRNIQPDLIINNRVGKGRQGMEGMNAYEDAAGDFGTPEQEILEGTSSMDWESCMTMNDHWGFNQFDSNYKSTETLIHNLLDIAAKGGNYLLNVGPTAEGLIPPESVVRLNEIGDWMKINGEVIHNTRGTKHYREGDNIYYVRSKDDQYLYAVLMEWPGRSIHLKYAEPEHNSEMYLLGYEQALEWEDQKEEGIFVELPIDWRDENNRPVNHAFIIKMNGKQALVAEAPQISIDEKHIEAKSLFSDKASIQLTSATEGATIYYTLDGRAPGTQSNKYEQPIKIKESGTIKAIAVKNEFVNSLVSSVDFMKSETFKSVIYKHPFSSKYSALGDLSIGDGVFGAANNFTENWLGFEGDDLDVKIDLGEVKEIKKVKANFLQVVGSWIFYPDFVNVSTSVDGKQFQTVADLNNNIPQNESGNITQLFEADFSSRPTRYIQIKAKNIGRCPDWHPGAGGKAWIFIDEVIVE